MMKDNKSTEDKSGTETEEVAHEPKRDYILVSGMGDMYVEENSGEFEVVSSSNSDKINATKYQDITQAREAARTMLNSQLKSKLEKSIRTENLVVLAGAGASTECDGPSMNQLWNLVKEDSDITDNWNQLLDDAGYNPDTEGENLESLLSNLQTITRSNELNEKIGRNFSDEINGIEKRIVDECKKVLVKPSSPHVRLISRILKARGASSSRLKVFTLNYDTAFEQAASRIAAVFIDGFLFSYNKSFRSADFDLDVVQRERSRIHHEENFYSKVFHLYKVHGSVDWKVDMDSNEIIKDPATENPLLIYPNSSKFEKSFEMPFFEMMSRLQSILRKENTSLIIIGYGFGDDHINRVIEEAARNNLNLEIFIVKRTLKGERINSFIQLVRKGSMNIHLIGSTFDGFSAGIPDVKIGASIEGSNGISDHE